MAQTRDRLLQNLARQVRGEVIGPGDAEYEGARRVFNGSIDRSPRAIVRVSSTEDVATAVRLASGEGLGVAVRCGAHHPEGFATCDDGIVIDLQHLNRVSVDSSRSIVHFGGGSLMKAVDAATIAAGFVSNGGTFQTVGTGGLFLNGGVNYLVRLHGFACDQLVAAEVITASGDVLRVDGTRDADVLWGLKGAGACLGVVTEMQARIHPLPATILAGWLLYDHTHAPDLLRFVRDFVVDAPDKLFVDVWFFHVASSSYFPVELHGRTAVGVTIVYMGDPDEGSVAVRELRERFPAASDTVRTTTYADLNVRDYDGGAWNERGLVNYWKSEYLDTLSDEVIDGLTTAAPQMSTYGDFYLLPIRGAMVRPSADETAYGARTPGWVVHVEALWREEQEPTEPRKAWMRDLHSRVLEPHGLGYPYQNASMEETRERMQALYGGGRLPRLHALKKRLDPANTFRHNPQNVLWDE